MHRFKNLIYILLLYNTFLFQKINSMEDATKNTKNVFEIKNQPQSTQCTESEGYVYFHAAGESSQLGPGFDYKNQNIKNSSFYGQKNVKTAVEFLKNINSQKTINSFHLDGMSMGAGVLLKTLEQLCFAADNTSHYIDDIVTKEEAIDLIAKINAGVIILSVPIFSMQHTQLMVFASRSFSLITISLLYSLLNNILLQEMSYKKHCIIFIGLVFLLQNMLSSKWSDIFDKKIIQRFISENYDPNHLSPLQAAKNIRNHITCPILIHISENDEFLYYTKRAIEDFFNALSTSNQPTSNTILLLSKDGTHDHNNNDFKTIKNEFLCDPINYLPTKCIDEGNTKKSIIYDSTLDKPIHISYKDPVFPLISSGINCIKAYVFNKVIKKKEISHAYI